jgi:predicted transcriptional regulator YdeE
MRDEGFKMAIDFGTHNIRIYNSYSDIIELYQNYLMLYQGKPSEEHILSICEANQDKAKFHFLIVDREKQTNDALAILKILNTESYE